MAKYGEHEARADDGQSSVTSLSPDLSSAQFSVNLNPATHG